MYFNSLQFAVFFILVLTLVSVLRRVVWARNLILLAASYYFYSCWDWRFLSLIVASTLVDYTCGLLLDPHRPQAARRRKIVLSASVLGNVGLLGFFKYYDFFITSALKFLSTLGVNTQLSTLNVILPVGISFYTFQTLSYTIDLYRRRVEAERNLLNFAVFVAFFPQLVAGPIERASRLLPQIQMPSSITYQRLYSGFYLIGWGLFKKIVLADNIAPFVDGVFADSSPNGLSALMGIYAFGIQIYCDFSGYSDIAVGTARCMGIELTRNFNLPFFTTNPSEFWRRWHISLSSWLRDYVYIPLGGNRRGGRRTYINLLLTMVLGGLWHGAGWTFILWGVYHGTLLCVHRMWRHYPNTRLRSRYNVLVEGWFWGRVFVNFNLISAGWVLFRAESWTKVVLLMEAILTNFSFAKISGLRNLPAAVAGIGFLLIVQLIQHTAKDIDFARSLNLPLRSIAYFVLILGIICFGAFDGNAFIYFQF